MTAKFYVKVDERYVLRAGYHPFWAHVVWSSERPKLPLTREQAFNDRDSLRGYGMDARVVRVGKP